MANNNRLSEGLMYAGGQELITTHLQFSLFSWEVPVWKELFGFLSSAHLSSVEKRKKRLRHV